MDRGEKIVYWAPVFFDKTVNWNMLYYDPISLYEHTRKSMVTDAKQNDKRNNFFYCPAYKDVAKNTFLLLNPIETDLVFDNNIVRVKSTNFISPELEHSPSMNGNRLVTYGLKYIFFTEDDIDLTLTAPFFSANNYSQEGAIVPARLKINSWFRVLNLEINLWKDVTTLHIEKDQPIAYVNFITQDNAPVKLVRFEMNEKLHSYATGCGTSSSWESHIPLFERYVRFKKTRMNNLVLKEIKNNLV